jgi:hypothetical protein
VVNGTAIARGGWSMGEPICPECERSVGDARHVASRDGGLLHLHCWSEAVIRRAFERLEPTREVAACVHEVSDHRHRVLDEGRERR